MNTMIIIIITIMTSLTIESGGGNNRLVKQEKGKADVMVGFHIYNEDDDGGDDHDENIR